MSRALERVRSAFEKPPAEFAPLAFWFWNGELQEAELGRQIDEFVAKGVHGGFMHARRPLRTPYLGERWWDAVDYSVRKGARSQFKTWIYDEYAWPSGAAGDTRRGGTQTASKVLAGGPAHHAKTLVRNILEVEGPTDVTLEGRYPQGEPVARIAARQTAPGELDPSSMVDLTEVGAWSCPEGSWRIFSFASRSIDDHVDYLQPETVRRFLDVTYEAYAKQLGSEFGKTIPGVFFDEPHIAAAPLPWTARMAEAFEASKGYSLLQKLPMLVYRAGAETVKVRCDFYDVVASLYEEAWFKQIGAWCEAHKLAWTGHTEEHAAFHPARQGDYFRTLRHVTIPGTDVHTFRYRRPRTIQPAEIKGAVSVAAMHDRERVMAEAFGGAGWGVTLANMRLGAALLATLGVDMQVLHGFFYSMDRPDAADDWPSSLFFQNPYWEHFGLVSNFIARLSSVVNASRATSTVAVLYPLTSIAANTADGRPNVRAREIGDAFEALIDGLFERQVDVHVVDEVFVAEAKLKSGVLSQGALQIDTVILPPVPVIARATIRRLTALAKEGGFVIATGELPGASSDAGGSDRTLTRAVREMFGAEGKGGPKGIKVGKGRAYALATVGDKLLDTVAQLVATPVTATAKAGPVYVTHRELDGAELILVVNGAANEQDIQLTTLAKGAAEVWNPETGEMRPIGMSAGRSTRSCNLRVPAQSAQVVVFDSQTRARPVPAGPRSRPKNTDLSSDWQFGLETGTETAQGSVRRLQLPVMRFADFSLGEGRLEQLRDPNYDDHAWRLLWLRTPAADVVGNWRGTWITGVRMPHGWVVMPSSDDHERLRFTKTVTLTEPPIRAWATFAGVDRATVYLNGTPLGESQDWNNPVTYNIMPYLRLGENTIVADVARTSSAPIALIFESQIDLRSGESAVIVSDKSWDVAAPRSELWVATGYDRDVPIVTWERGRPPTRPWGHVPLLGEPVKFPRTLMYRQNLPVGCVGIGLPAIKGVHKVYVDVRERTPDIHGIYNITTGGMLSIEIAANDFSAGVLAPLELYTRPTSVKLKPWSEYGYSWFSGTATYERSFDLTAVQAAGRVTLDLGDVRHHVELTLNNRRIGARVWPPYVFDLTNAVQKGSNHLRMRVSNLLANEMRWRRDESQMYDPWHRYWHETNIEPEALVSGLLGPVTLRVG